MDRVHLLSLKPSLDRPAILAKWFLKLSNGFMVMKQKSAISRKRGWNNFQGIAISVLYKSKRAIPPLFNGPEMLSFVPVQKTLFAEIFSENSNLNSSDISLPAFLLELL